MGSSASSAAHEPSYDEILVGDIVVVRSKKRASSTAVVQQVLRNGNIVADGLLVSTSDIQLVPSPAAMTRRRIVLLCGAYESECERLDIAPHPTVREILNTAAEHARAPTSIDLSRQQLGDKDAIALSVVFKDLTRLETLDLSFNHIGVLGCKELARSLDGCQVDVLNLANNLLEKEGLAEIAQSVRCRVLDVSGNRVRATDGLAPLATCLEELVLDDNPFTYLSLDGVGALARLRRLSACSTGINNLWTTVSVLQRLPALHELQLQRPQPPSAPPVLPAAAAAPAAPLSPAGPETTPPAAAAPEGPSPSSSGPSAGRSSGSSPPPEAPAGPSSASSSHPPPAPPPASSSLPAAGPSGHHAALEPMALSPAPLANSPAAAAAGGPGPAGGAGWQAAVSWEDEHTPPQAAPGEAGEVEEGELNAEIGADGDGSDLELPDAEDGGPDGGPPEAAPAGGGGSGAAGRQGGGGTPVCGQLHYRDFLLANLPQLQLLDTRPATPAEREAAAAVYQASFEPLANGRCTRPSLFRLVALRELGIRSRDTRPARRRPAPRRRYPPTFPPALLAHLAPHGLPVAGPSSAELALLPTLPLLPGRTGMLPPAVALSEPASPSSAGNSPSCFPAVACFRRLRAVAVPPGRLPRAAVPELDPIPAPAPPPLPVAPPLAPPAFAAPGPSGGEEGRRRWGVLEAAGEAGGCTPAAFQRSACASLQGSAWRPGASLLSPPARYRPRQFEYHPSIPEYMVFGTLSGDVVVVNHHTSRVVGQVRPAASPPHSILGLCWLHSPTSTRFIAGSDNGSIQLYELSVVKGGVGSVGPAGPMPGAVLSRHKYQDFEQLTSVHVNATDDLFLASGYSNHVGLYDVSTGRRLQTFNDLHTEHINVLKFANHAPALFATSSFDRDIKLWDLREGCARPIYTRHSDRGNVMVCFSPDDQYLLASAIDNEVRQYVAADGRLHLKLDVEKTGSLHNYTRSYYMNGRDYIISGSCEESLVRVHCARTGRALRDVPLDNARSSASLYVQSLRGDPFASFELSVLVAYNRSSPPPEIVKVSLLV